MNGILGVIDGIGAVIPVYCSSSLIYGEIVTVDNVVGGNNIRHFLAQGGMGRAYCHQPVAPVASYGVGHGVGVGIIAVAILIL